MAAVYTSSYQVPYRNREAQFTNGDEGHVYAPLNIRERPNGCGYGNNQEIVANDMNPHSNSPISVDQCVYGLMEELIMAGFKEPVKGTENDIQPVYNVLELTYLKASQRPGHCGTTSAEGPVDNTLEGPVNDKGNYTKPVYNVLKGPYLESAEEPSHYGALHIKEPVYNTLEGPANNIENDTQAMYMSSTCPKEPFYNTLERPFQSNDNDTQPVYSVLEAADLEGAAGTSRYSAMSPERPVCNTLKESYPDNTNKLDSEIKNNEPIYNVLEEEPWK